MNAPFPPPGEPIPDLAARLNAGLRAAQAMPGWRAPEPLSEAAEIVAGQVWETISIPQEGQPPAPSGASALLVLVLECNRSHGVSAATVVPIFHALEFSSDEDAILTRTALGFTAAVAIARTAEVLADDLREPVAALPAGRMELLQKHQQWLFSAEAEASGIAAPLPIGPPIIDVHDAAVEYHAFLSEQLGILQGRLWERIEVIASGSEKVPPAYLPWNTESDVTAADTLPEFGSLTASQRQAPRLGEWCVADTGCTLQGTLDGEIVYFSVFDAEDASTSQLDGAELIADGRVVGRLSEGTTHCAEEVLRAGFILRDPELGGLELVRIDRIPPAQ